MDLNEVIFITDLDGTLLTDEKEILPQDMAAIEHFRKGGGKFTIATGRGYAMARSIAEKLKLDMPAVIFNGAAIYDFAKSEMLWHCSICSHAVEYVKMLMENIPDIGIEILREKEIYVPAMNDTVKAHVALENLTPIECELSEVPQNGWLKVLVAYPAEDIDKVIEFAQENCTECVNWVHSAPCYYEMLPEGISKGAGFEKLLEITDNEDRITFAAGDYGNDYDMVKIADFGIAVANAQQAVKNTAQLVVCDNNSGAMCEVISYIENM